MTLTLDKNGTGMTYSLTGKSSPWGIIQDSEEIAEGIIYVSTASHGGIWVAPELLSRITTEMKDYAAYWSGSSQWFEEDCAAQCVVVSFPEHFEADQVERAWAIVRRYVTKEAVA
jgi:hypothetical protein